jgi:uncharacterized DUF497 family protein
MEFQFDSEKDAANRAKHGVSLVLGAVVLANRVGEAVDERFEYGEVRINAFGMVNDRLYVCTYTVRDRIYRLISVRKASRQERRIWLQ